MARPSQGGEKRAAVWASRLEDMVSDGVVAPHMCDHRLVPALDVALHRYNPLGQSWTPAVMLPYVRDGLSVL